MKRKIFYFVLMVSLVFIPFFEILAAEVLVSENFDEWDDYCFNEPGYSMPSPFSPYGAYPLIQETIDSLSHCPLEIAGPGRGGTGKAIQIHRNGSLWIGNPPFYSFDMKPSQFPGMVDGNYNSLYMRWYMKVPTDFHFPEAQKLHRYNFSSGQLNFNIIGNSYSGGQGTVLAFLVGGSWYNLAPIADWRDGQWHAHQIFVDIPTATVTYWLDGVQKFSLSGIPGMPPIDAHFGDSNGNFIQHFPYGNSFLTPEPPPGWVYFEVDDVVIATTKEATDPIEWSDVPASFPSETQTDAETKSSTIGDLPTKGALLLTESFQDTNWSSRGWFDGTNSTGVTSSGYSGNALKWTWAVGAQTPTGFSTLRRIMDEPVDEFILEYYVKYEENWRGSGLTYHPHTLHMVSSEDTIYQGGANSNSALYFSQISGTSAPYHIQPKFGHQDSMRVNTSFGTPTNNLTSTTEDRSANLCNTPLALTGADYGDCYSMGGGVYYSYSGWSSPSIVVPTDKWVKLVYYIKSNTVTNGTANFDGIVKVWVDNELAINKQSVQFVAGANEGATWDKFMMAPYIGNGSPMNQTMWLDELRIWSVAEGTPSIVQPPPMLQLIQ